MHELAWVEVARDVATLQCVGATADRLTFGIGYDRGRSN
jgi:hypothetical protein